MNTSEKNTTERPFGYWLKAVDRLMAAEFDAAFQGEGASRRDWRLLNLLDGTAPADRPLPRHRLNHLADRGWIAADGDGWALTDEGRAAKERLGALVDGIRAKVTDAVAPDDLATTLSTLESIARAFGWDESTPLPRRRGREHGHGRADGRGWRRGFARAFGPVADHVRASVGHGDDAWGHGHGFGPRRGEHAHGEHGHREHRHGEHAHGEHGHRGHFSHGHPQRPGHPMATAVQHAYERGFDAGFARGREA